MATDVDDTLPRSMSLSRRYLSLPQELTGESLPPKVSGRRYGTVTLCVAHILPSAVSSSPLPRESFVRVRWWGEEAPGSLFRPKVLSGDGVVHSEALYSPHRIIAMKYPVNVLPEQLLEYFHDMGHLTLDVIDRDTRKQFGECKLPLDLYRDNQVMTMKEKLVALKRDNVLCEIKPSEGQEGEVAGYLAVTFDVHWTESDVKIDDDMGIVADYLDAEVPVSDWVEVVDSEETKGVFKVESKMIEKEKELKKSRRKDDVENSAHFQRIQKLLEKGKALQQSMERAVTDEKKKDNNGEIGEKDEDPVLTNYTVDQPIHRGLPFEPDTVAEFVGSSIQWSKVLTDDARLSNSEPSAESDNDFLPPSISSDSSEVQVKHGGAAGPLLSGYTLDQRLHQEVQQRTQLRTFLRNSSNKYKSFQFAVMFESVSNVSLSVLGDKIVRARLNSSPIMENESVDGANVLNGANITLRYTVPSHFSRVSPASKKIDRSITRKLRFSRWFDWMSLLSADFRGSIHIFQSEFVDESKKFFSSGYLIIETWLQTARSAERRLLGLSKVPLKQLASLFSHDKEDLRSLSETLLPCVGVDGKFPVEDPFSGNLSGYLRARVCIGTAEQLLTWAKTIRSVVKLQGIVRGVLFRKQFRHSTIFRSASIPGTSQIHSRLVALLNEENGSDSQSTAPTFITTRKANGFDTSEKQLEYTPKDPEVHETGRGNQRALRKIRLGIRESWRSVVQHNGQKSKQQRCGWSSSPLLGCEIQGQLVLTGNTEVPGKIKGVSFALWWDAVNRHLNSCFIHTFRSRAYLNEERADLAAVGPQSQILFALHVENGFFGTQSRETIMGEARLNLYEAFGKRVTKRQQSDGSTQNMGVEESWTDVDVPIVWDNGITECRKLPSAIPLKVTYFTSRMSESMPITMDFANLEGDVSDSRSLNTEPQFDAGASETPEQHDTKLSRLADEESLDENVMADPAVTLPQRSDEQSESEVEENVVPDNQFSHSLLPESDDENEKARGTVCSLLPGSECDNEESHDTECRLESDEQLDQSLGLEHLSEDGAVLGHSLELEDLSSGSDSVPSETVSLPDYNTGEVEIPDSIPSSPKCAPTIQYAEKAVQVNLIEPGLHVEMVACAVQTAPLADSKDECDEIDWDNDVEEAKTTVDVGCDAMEIGDIPSGNNSESEEEAPQSNAELDRVTLDVPSETSSIPCSDTAGAELLTESCSDHSLVPETEYVDEAVQANPFELGFVVEMVECSVQTAPTADSKAEPDKTVFKESGDESNLGDFAEEQKITVNVGCDPIEFTEENHVQSEEEEPQFSASTMSTRQEQDDKTPKAEHGVTSPRDIVDHVSTPLIIEQPSMTHTTLPNEKLDLMYEMLREMRESYLRQPAAKSASVGSVKDEVYHARGISDKHSSCPSSPVSRPPSAHRARKTSLDKSSVSVSEVLPTKSMVDIGLEVKAKRCSCPSSLVTQEPQSLRSRGSILVESSRHTSGLKPATVLNCNPTKTSSQRQLSGKSVANKTPGLYSYREQRTDTSGKNHRLSSSDMCVFQKRYNSQSENTSNPSSVRSLFAHDSETERIARIMQGSMNYWMKDDSSSSGGDELEEETDDDCYF
ncbi:hypothetical protein F441_17863 [Phytophthora nicotianae CJ01A1]|uniref:C2CD3 N-terminal C2 domain-containing protein n=2 Tax=Phytophthora nicotianae CJ01A1 TaxID=1317063 RepID=W2W4U5_PHYNI|nr:hypothetical protein F441_17863 [Phytophthora nicotianae CJ01A1]